ncbi:MAG: L-serine ammonia-lyase, iron-sulfur-dependent subunit beta [Firmicutes bacterium]|nr:L-serine ammonia-lyase, iron-sulfur-dependent subunit beta [Bacillota bacterium]
MRVFEVLGPVMVGPSSSHTAGAARIGRAARAVLGAPPAYAHIALHGSFAATGRGHGTDRAIVAGLLGFSPGDPRLRQAFAYAAAAGLRFDFREADLGRVHPNTARIRLGDGRGREADVLASSVGGGRAVVLEVDGFDLRFDLARPTALVFHRDRPGAVAAVTAVLARHGVNIAAMQVARKERGGEALMVIESDGPFPPSAAVAIDALPEVSARLVGGEDGAEGTWEGGGQ